MDLALYAAVILLYATGLVWFATRIARRSRRARPVPEGIDPHAAERGDLIDPTSIFRYREEDEAIEALLAEPEGGRPAAHPQAPADRENERRVRELLLSAEPFPEARPEDAEPAPAAEKPADPEPSLAQIEELVVETLLADGFTALLDHLKSAPPATCVADLPRLFAFRDDERFVFAVAEMLAHPAPEVQEACRRLVEGAGDPALLDELVDVSVNQTHHVAAGAGTDPEIARLDRAALIERLERESDPERALALAGALARDPDPSAVEACRRAADRLLEPQPAGRLPARRSLQAPPPESRGGMAFRERMALARIGAAFRVAEGEAFLRERAETYEREELDRDLFEAAKDPNEFVRGKALLKMGETLLTARALLCLRERLSDGAPHVRACAAEALAGFALRARGRKLVESTREVRQMLLSALLAERAPEAARRIEAALYRIERAPGMPAAAPPLPPPEPAAARFAMKPVDAARSALPAPGLKSA